MRWVISAAAQQSFQQGCRNQKAFLQSCSFAGIEAVQQRTGSERDAEGGDHSDYEVLGLKDKRDRLWARVNAKIEAQLSKESIA
jgi:hypothetical protein